MNLYFQSLLISVAVLAGCVSDPFTRQVKEFDKAVVAYLDLSEAGRWQEALPYAKRVYELNQDLREKNHEITAQASWQYARSLEQTGGDNELATRLYSDSLEINESLFGAGSPKLVAPLLGLGRTSQKAGDLPKSRQHFDRALLLAEKYHGAYSVEMAKFFMDNIDNSMMMALNPYVAGEYLEISYETLKKELGEKDKYTGYAAFHLGQYSLATKDYKRGKTLLLEALSIFENLDKPDNRMEALTHGLLGRYYEFMGERTKAERHFDTLSRIAPATGYQDYFAVYREMPEYPRSAKDNKKEGQVIVVLTISPIGTVENPIIAESTDEAFNEASLRAVGKFRYAPRFVDGKPVSVPGVQVKIVYKDGIVIYPLER